MATRQELESAGYHYDKSSGTYFRGKGKGRSYTKVEAEKASGLPTASEKVVFARHTDPKLLARVSEHLKVPQDQLVKHRWIREDIALIRGGIKKRGGKVDRRKYHRVLDALRRLTGTQNKQASWTPFLSP